MNSAPTTEGRHPPDTRTARRTARTRRLGLLDRAALSLGVALIRWGRRSGRSLDRHSRLAIRPGPARLELVRAEAQGRANLLGRVR